MPVRDRFKVGVSVRVRVRGTVRVREPLRSVAMVT